MISGSVPTGPADSQQFSPWEKAAAKGGFQVGKTAKSRSGHRVQSLPIQGHGRLQFFDEPPGLSGAESTRIERSEIVQPTSYRVAQQDF
jgi:hypothetical protein